LNATSGLERELGEKETQHRQKVKLLKEYRELRVLTTDPKEEARLTREIGKLEQEVDEIELDIETLSAQFNEERFVEALKPLDYTAQKRHLSRLISGPDRIASCVVVGRRDRGLYWLAQRMLDAVPSRPESAKKVTHDFASPRPSDPDSVLASLCEELGIPNLGPARLVPAIAHRVAKTVESRSVVLVFDNTDRLGPSGLEELIERVWCRVATAARGVLTPGLYTRLFAVFLYHGDLEVPAAVPHCHHHLAYLPPLLDFDENVLSGWIQNAMALPPSLLDDDFPKDLVARTAGNPERVVTELSLHFEFVCHLAAKRWWAKP
jgi:hypothetical protein